MSRTFTSTCPPSHEGLTNTWFTPKWLIDELGEFDLDPCSQSYRPFDIAKLHYNHDSGICGLASDWSGRVWLNPPYGKALPLWLEKFSKHKNGVALVFARMGNQAIQDSINKGAHFFFFRKRVRFIDINGEAAKANPGADSCLIFYNQKERNRIINSNLEGVVL